MSFRQFDQRGPHGSMKRLQFVLPQGCTHMRHWQEVRCFAPKRILILLRQLRRLQHQLNRSSSLDSKNILSLLFMFPCVLHKTVHSTDSYQIALISDFGQKCIYFRSEKVRSWRNLEEREKKKNQRKARKLRLIFFVLGVKIYYSAQNWSKDMKGENRPNCQVSKRSD